MIRHVHLHGSLADLANTKQLDLNVDTPLRLMSALRTQVKGFRRWCNENKLAIVLTVENREPVALDTSDFTFQFGKATDIHLIPETEGAGVEWAAVAAWLASYGITSTVVIAVVYVAVNLAIAYALGAVAQALAPSPNTSDGGGRAEERPSFLFNGPVNVVEQGYAIPLIYGIHTSGSIVVSAGVSVEEIPYVPPQPEPPGQPDWPPAEPYQWSYEGA